jgi:hypothetical protein
VEAELSREQFEAGDTLQFTFVSSVAPDAAPRFNLTNNSATLISSLTATSSDTTSFYAMVTMPASADGVYMGEWFAQKTVSGDTLPFYKRFLFNVARTRVPT